MRLLIVGGSPRHLGGVEAFCDRSIVALSDCGDWQIGRIPADTAFLTWRRLPAVLQGLARVFRLRAREIDCVWLQYANLPDLMYLAFAKLLGLRVMVTPHLGTNWRSQSNPALRKLSGWLLGFADRLALISRTQETEVNLPSTVSRSYIRNFLPAAILSSEPPARGVAPALQIIHSGRLSEGKGTFLFVEVCQQLRAKSVPFFARITGAGDAPTMRRLNAMIAEYRLEEHVAVLGRVPDAELIELLRQSDLLVHLSRIDSYPLIVLEAVACGVAPLCLDLAGARDMVNAYGGHVVGSTRAVEETADFIGRQDVEDLRRRARGSAILVREDSSWVRCAAALDAALRACAAGDVSSSC
jgi:glycosyltransferase involved in cell wall biosynthesis